MRRPETIAMKTARRLMGLRVPHCRHPTTYCADCPLGHNLAAEVDAGPLDGIVQRLTAAVADLNVNVNGGAR